MDDGGRIMVTPNVATVIKIIETLPESAQALVAQHLLDYLTDMQDDLRWDATYRQSQDKLMSAARCAHHQIAEGHAQPLDSDRL
jgi:hypothetical protein